MTIIIPSRTTKKINQNGRSKVLGDLWSSFGLDLQSDLGIIKVYPRMQVTTFGVPGERGLSVAFSTFNTKIFTLADTRIFYNTATDGVIDATTPFNFEDVGSGSITTYSKDTGDLKTFNLMLCATAQTALMSRDISGTWTNRATLTTGYAHKMLYFPNSNRLYFLEANNIHSLDTSWAEATPNSDFALNLVNITEFDLGIPYTMEEDGTDIWIGMMQTNTAGDGNVLKGAYIIRWDGQAQTFTTPYHIKARGILALCKDDRNIIHAFDTNGALLQFTGSGFEEIGRLPLNKSILTNANSSVYNAFVHPNGLQFTRNGTFIVAVNNLVSDATGSIKENLASGIWEFSKDTGFVHRGAFTYTPAGSTTVTDYGQNRIAQIGALAEIDMSSVSINGTPTLLCGATLYNDASTTSDAILIDDPFDTTTKYGNFVTSWFLASGLTDNWNKVALRYRRLLNVADRIWLKYRTHEVAPTNITMTWVTPTTFTTPTDLSDTSFVGYEVEVLQGTGSGKCAHIVSGVVSFGLCLVTIDESFVGVTTGTALGRVQAWKKLTVVADQTTESLLKGFLDGSTSARVQVKCCMQFTGSDELYELMIINNVQEPLVS